MRNLWMRNRNDADTTDNWSMLYADEDRLDDTEENIMKNLDDIVDTASGVKSSERNEDGTYHIVFDHGYVGDFFVELGE